MEYNHIDKITESYQKLLKLLPNKKPNKELLEAILDIYTFAYESGEFEQSDRVHYYYRDLIKEEELLKHCHGKDSYYKLMTKKIMTKQ